MRSASRLFAAALVLAAVVRVLFIALPAVPLKAKAIDSIGDAREYAALGENLARRQVFSRDSAPPYRPELFRTPGYPLLLAVPFAVFGSSLAWPLALQVLLALGIVLLSRRLALELGLEPASASVAALLVALSPNLAFLSSKLVSEMLFSLLLVACLLLLNRFRKHGRTADLVATGVTSGLLVLTRPIALFFPLVIGGYVLWLKLRDRKLRFWQPLVPLACASIVALPWVVRNGVQTGRYIVSTASDHNTYLYTAATVVAAEKGISLTAARDSLMAEAVARFPGLDSNDEASFWQRLAQVGRDHIRRRPLLAVKVSAAGFLGSFILPISVGPLIIHSTGQAEVPGQANAFQRVIGLAARGRLGQALATARDSRLRGLPGFAAVVLSAALVFNLVLLVCALAALFPKRNSGLLWLLLPILYFTLVTGTVGEARFRAPIEPFLAILAATALARPRQKPD
jgi:4-amino-4-deoxy-L-arabinose transferase-like glycosyltransferase